MISQLLIIRKIIDRNVMHVAADIFCRHRLKKALPVDPQRFGRIRRMYRCLVVSDSGSSCCTVTCGIRENASS